MKQKQVLITGANSGIGKAIALRLAREGAHVIMVCRNKEKGEKARELVAKESGDNHIDLITADLSSIKDVLTLVETVKNNYEKLDVLINNAGVISPERVVTVDGFEQQFAVNYLAPFVLTSGLKQLLKASGHGRVVHVSSGAHKIGRLDFEDLQLMNHYSAFRAYSQSKLALTMLTLMQAKAYESYNITVNCLHPGAVATNISVDRSNNARLKLMRFLSLFFLTPEDGAETAIHLASHESVANMTGQYFYKMKISKPSKKVFNPHIQEKLLTQTLQLLKPFGVDDV